MATSSREALRKPTGFIGSNGFKAPKNKGETKMEKKQKISTRKIVFVALMAALTVVGSALRIQLPVAIGSTTAFHLGNIFCALSGILLGPWLGGLAAGLGSFLYDIMSNYISECWITFLTKGAYGLVAGLIAWGSTKNWNYVKALIATVAGALTYAVLYLAKSYFYNGLLVHGYTSSAALADVVAKLPATTFNAVVAIVFAPVLAVSIRKALEHNHLTLE